MTVTDKQKVTSPSCASLGASPGSVMRIFIVQGAFGRHRHGGGCHLGLLVARNVDVIVPAIERAPNVSFCSAAFYSDQPHAERPASGRHRAHHHLPVLAFVATLYLELARQPRAAGGGAPV